MSTYFTLCRVLLQPTVRIKLAMYLNLSMVYILLAFINHEL
jgi:multisubunit Na+/H+ antiporter MnhF subunit